MIQKEEPLFLPHWYPQSWLCALFWGCLSQTGMHVLAIRVSTDNYTSGVFLSSHLIWASQLISLHLSFPACKTDNHVGTTQHGLIEVLASPLATEARWSLYLKPSKTLLHWSLYLPSHQQPLPTLGCAGSPPWTSLLWLWAVGDPAKNSSAGTSVLDAAVHQIFFFKELILWTFLLKKKIIKKKKEGGRGRNHSIRDENNGPIRQSLLDQAGGRWTAKFSCWEGECVWCEGLPWKKCQCDVRRARPPRETAPEWWWGLPRAVHYRQEQCHLSWEHWPPQMIKAPHVSSTHTAIPHSTTEHQSEPLVQWKVIQLSPRMKIYQLNNFSTEEIAADMLYLFRRRCPLVLNVLVALAMETLVCLERDGQA